MTEVATATTLDMDAALEAAKEALRRYRERRDWCADYALRRDRILHRYRPSGPRGEEPVPPQLGRVSDETARRGVALAELEARYGEWAPEIEAIEGALAHAGEEEGTVARMRYLDAREATWDEVASALGCGRTTALAIHRELLRRVAMWMGLIEE